MIRILLAEDDQVMREYLARALERSGYSVAAVDRGTAALPPSTYLTALSDSTIHPGSGEWSSTTRDGISTPHLVPGMMYGPSSKSPFFTRFPAAHDIVQSHRH